MPEFSSLFGAEQELLFRSAVAFLREHRVREAGADPRTLLREITALGWLSLGAPGDAAEGGIISAATLAEAHGYAGVHSPFIAAIVATAALRQTDAGAEHGWYDGVASVLTVPAVVDLPGDGAGAVRYRGIASGVELSGTKIAVEFAGMAGLLLVAAGNDVDDSAALFLVPAHAGGIDGSTGITLKLTPSAGNPWASAVYFDRLPAGRPAATGGTALAAIEQLQQTGAALRAAELAGIGRAALELTLDYARARVQFGRPIGSFQAVHHHCADMLRDLTATRLLAAQAAWRLENGMPAGRAVHMAKAKASEAVPALLRLAHQVCGGAGFYQDFPLASYSNRAIDARASYGTAHEHRRHLVTLLRRDPGALRHEDEHPLHIGVLH